MLPLALAAGLAVIHLTAGRLRFLGVIPRSAWLSGASGASVAYVFVHLLPELAEGQAVLAEAAGQGLRWLEAHVWLLALVGLAAFYGLERAAIRSREEERVREGEDRTAPGVFWLHIGAFALYNVLVGYLLVHRESPGTASLLLYAAAMGLHFFVNDYGLRQHHKALYRYPGRWLLAVAVVGGAALGLLTTVGETAVAALVAFLGGGVVLNVLKEELPEERQSQFWAFALGAAAYTALLLVA